MAITDLTRRKCLITGAASGIGRATAVMAGEIHDAHGSLHPGAGPARDDQLTAHSSA